MGRWLAWGGIAVGAVYLVYAGGGWLGIYSPYLRLVTMAFAAVSLGIWGVVAWRHPAWRPRSALLPAMLLCFASLSISTVFSRQPRISAEYLGYAAVLGALYLLLVRLFADPFFRPRLAMLATMLFGITAVLFAAQVVVGWIGWWQTLGRLDVPPLRPNYVGLTYGNPSAPLTMVALLAAPAAATLIDWRRRAVGFATAVAILAVIAVTALISGSRAGWFALGITGMIAIVLWLASSERRAALLSAVRPALARRSRRAAAIVGLVVLGAAAIVLAPTIAARVLAGGEDLRLSYSVAAIRMFLDSPFVGTGPGTWVIQRPAYTLPSEPDGYIPHTHDLETQTLAELGVLGLAIGVVAVIAIARLFITAANGPDADRRRWAWAGGLALLYFGLHQVLDFYMNMPAFLFAAGVPIAYLDATSAQSTRRGTLNIPSFARRAGATLGAALIVVAVSLLSAQELPAVELARAVDAANAGDWGAATEPAQAAAAADPDVGSYDFVAGLATDRAGNHAAAAGYFQRVVGSADLPEAWLNLAAEQATLGQADEARVSLARGLRLGIQRPAMLMAAGELSLRLGDHATALEDFATAVADAPSLAGDPWWQSRTDTRAIFRNVVAQAMALNPRAEWELAIESGNRAVAEWLADDTVIPEHLLTAAWFGDPAAAAAVVAGCQQNALDQNALDWCARVETHLGNLQLAESFRALIWTIAPGYIVSSADFRIGWTGVSDGPLAGGVADQWATYTYRRPGTWDVLVPSLIHLRLDVGTPP